MDVEQEDTFERELELESCDVTLTFLQKKEGDVSCVVWDAALVLAKYLDLTCERENWLKDKRVLELGAGVGCAGLTAACLGAHVILTDLPDVLPLLQRNVDVNRAHWQNAGGTVQAGVLEWGKEINLNFKPDIILLTDCVYYEESVKPLLHTLEFLCNNPRTYAILSQEERDTPNQNVVWHAFLAELNSRFRIEYIPVSEQDPTYSSNDIHLMKIFKK